MNDKRFEAWWASNPARVACENTGRRFIGIERDPTYFDVAVCRVSDAALFGPA